MNDILAGYWLHGVGLAALVWLWISVELWWKHRKVDRESDRVDELLRALHDEAIASEDVAWERQVRMTAALRGVRLAAPRETMSEVPTTQRLYPPGKRLE